MDDFEDLPEPCPLCGGTLAFLGTLGFLAHFRCIHCGIVTSSPVAHELEIEHVDLPA